MTPQQIALVQESFGKVRAIRELAAGLFYNRLFEIDPSTRPLFKADLTRQGAKLMAALETVIRGLARLDQLLAEVRALGRRHAAYGVEDRHYASVGAALLWTLEQGLGADFSPEVRDAWAAAYGTLSEAMMDAAQAAPLPAIA